MKIIVMILDAGGGHRSVARAVQSALHAKFGSESTISLVELSQLPESKMINSIPGHYARLTRSLLPLYDLSWHLSNNPFSARQISRMVYLIMRRSIHAVLQADPPDLVIAGNAFLSDLLALARKELHQDFRISVVVSDLASIHASWTSPQADLTFVPNRYARERLLRIGISTRRLVEIGFPVQPRFLNYRISREQARTSLGLDLERFTLLVTSGGVGSGRLVTTARSLLRRFPEHQWLIVTGMNRDAYRQLSAEASGLPVRVFGHADNMETLISASDLVITKAGPSTMMECLSLDRAMIVTGAVGAQEKGNMDLLRKDPRVFLAKSSSEMIRIIASGAKLYAGMAPGSFIDFNGAAQIAAVLQDWMSTTRDIASPAEGGLIINRKPGDL